MTAMRKAYVVQSLYWEYNDNWFDRKDDEPTRAFLDRDYAEFYRLELERTRRGRNPCGFAGGLDKATSLTEADLLDCLRDLGVPAPPAGGWNGGPDWWDEDWWATVRTQVARSWGDEDRLWDLFDRARYYEVVEVELAGDEG